MNTDIFYCQSCKRYTLCTTCTTCHGQTVSPLPPKWSPEDKYGKYRRAYKHHFSRPQSI